MGNITLKNVSKSFGSTVVIPDIDLNIEDSFVGIEKDAASTKTCTVIPSETEHLPGVY